MVAISTVSKDTALNEMWRAYQAAVASRDKISCDCNLWAHQRAQGAYLVIVFWIPEYEAGVGQHVFTGHEYDDATDLYYMGARYQNPEIGRFISQDPVFKNSPEEYLTDPQQANSYSYSRNNPLRFVDRTGERVSEYQPYYSSYGNMSYREGDVMGSYRGTNLYSRGSNTVKGTHYQCTDLAKRFSKAQYGLDLGGTGDGREYGNPNNESSNSTFKNNYTVNSNGSGVMPQENDLISWSGGENGHVGVIAEVVFDSDSGTGYVYTLEQNALSSQGLYAQRLTRTNDSNGNPVYTIDRRPGTSGNVKAWARTENQSRSSDSPTYTSTQHTPATKPLSSRP